MLDTKEEEGAVRGSNSAINEFLDVEEELELLLLLLKSMLKNF